MSRPTTLWYTRCPTPTAFSIAVQKGWIEEEFAQDGLAVRSLASSTDPQVRQAHFTAALPNFFRHGGHIPPLISRSRDADVRIVGLSWNAVYRPLLALPESGIRGIADLKGRRLSVPRRARDGVDFWKATALRGLSLALRRGGLTLDDVQLVDVSTGRTFVQDSRVDAAPKDSLWDARFMLGHQREEAFALVRGEVDAFYSQGAMAAIVEGFLGATTVVDLGRESAGEARNDAPYTLTVSGRLIDERPDLVARWLARVLQAADWARTHAGEAKSIIGVETGLATELVDRAFSPTVHAELQVDLASDKIAALQEQHDHLDSHGFLQQRIDFAQFIDVRPLEQAKQLLVEGLNRSPINER